MLRLHTTVQIAADVRWSSSRAHDLITVTGSIAMFFINITYHVKRDASTSGLEAIQMSAEASKYRAAKKDGDWGSGARLATTAAAW